MFSTAFLRDAAERAVSTFAQALVAAVLLDPGLTGGVATIHWTAVLSVAGLATLLAILKGVAAYKLGDNETGASLLTEAPPRVEAGRGDILYVLLVVVVLLVLLALLGVI